MDPHPFPSKELPQEMNTKFMQFLFNSAECAINLNKWLANISY